MMTFVAFANDQQNDTYRADVEFFRPHDDADVTFADVAKHVVPILMRRQYEKHGALPEYESDLMDEIADMIEQATDHASERTYGNGMFMHLTSNPESYTFDILIVRLT